MHNPHLRLRAEAQGLHPHRSKNNIYKHQPRNKDTPPGTLVLRPQGFAAPATSTALGKQQTIQDLYSCSTSLNCTYGFPAIHSFHPEPPVLFRQSLHGDNPWPAEKGGHGYEPIATGTEILTKVNLKETPTPQSERSLGLTTRRQA